MSAASRRFCQIARRVLEEEFDFLRKRTRFERRLSDRHVRRADDDSTVPWNGEQDAAIFGFRNHQRACAGKERALDHDVRTLARGDETRTADIVEAAHVVRENAGGIDDDARGDFNFVAALRILRNDACDAPILFHEPHRAQVIRGRAAEPVERLCQADGETRIVKLAVKVLHAAAQSDRFDGGNCMQRFRARNQFRRAKAEPSGQRIVEFQSDAVERPLPSPIRRDNERLLAREMGRVAQQQRTLVQRFAHQ